MQTNYNLYQAPFLVGQIYDTSIHQIDTFVAEKPISFGAPVMLGTLDRSDTSAISNNAPEPLIQGIESVLPYDGATTSTVLGVALRSDITPVGSVLANAANPDYTTQITRVDGTYQIGAPVRVLRIGRVVIPATFEGGKGIYKIYYDPATGLYYYEGSGGSTLPTTAVIITAWKVLALGKDSTCVVQL